MAGYVKTAAGNDTTALLLKKVDELVAAYTSLKASYATLVAKLNADAGVTDSNYVDGASAAPATAASELIS
jgi:hypothetical protein